MKTSFPYFKKSAATVLILVAATAATVFGQERFRAGDEVEIFCTCLGPMAWVRGRVEQVDGNGVKVRYGNGKYQVATVPNSPQTIVRPGQRQASAGDAQLRVRFFQEAAPFRNAVIEAAPFFDARFRRQRLPAPTELQKSLDALAALDALCVARYRDLRNDPNSPWPNDIEQQPATWCAVAAARLTLEKAFRQETAREATKTLFFVTGAALDKALAAKDNRAPDDVQRLVYDREGWLAEARPKAAAAFAVMKADVPDDYFNGLIAKADELKAAIARSAPTRSWTRPPYDDAAVEAFVRAKYPADPDYKGVTVLRTGLDYVAWKGYESLSYLGSDSNYRYYKVDYNEYKRGWSLVRLPGRPFCQAQEFIVGRKAGKLVLVSLGGSGIFMKCD